MQKGALITPAQRRAALDFQIKNERARATVKRGELQARTTPPLVARPAPAGALNVDSTANPDSDVYGGRRLEKSGGGMRTTRRAATRDARI